MKHTDHSRQFLVWLDDIIKQVKRDPKRQYIKRGAVTDYIVQGTKFLLPGNGILLDDPYLKGIDEKLPLSLPYPIIVLEFPDPWGHFHKTIITLKQDENQILMYVTVYHDQHKNWGTMAPIRFDRHHYIERNGKDQPDFLYSMDPNTPDELLMDPKVYYPYIVVFLQFLNAMSCKNVVTEKSPVSKVKKAMQKGPIPYDEYKVLTTFVTPREPKDRGAPCKGSTSATGITHASPREHLRRGHIVRMSTGKVYWRNATIVMPGNGGRIEKTYLVK